MSQLKIKNGNEWVDIPAGGVGVPSGGNAGDVLIKSSSTDYATEWGKKFSSTRILAPTQITTNPQTYTLAQAAENFDAFELRLYLDGDGTNPLQSAYSVLISRTALASNGAILSYYGTDIYWSSISFVLDGGVNCHTGRLQKSSNVGTAYVGVYGVKFA